MPVKTFLRWLFRILHYGRYGSGADDDRLWPPFIWDMKTFGSGVITIHLFTYDEFCKILKKSFRL